MAQSSTGGTTMRDNIGYALGDFGMQASFGLIASVLQKYYTDVLSIPIASVMVLFIVARIWDAVNDPMWGAFVDSRPARRGGRYRRFVKYFAVPTGLCTVLMFIKLPGLTGNGLFVYACITYILFGMIYTCMNVPYGSLASVITSNDRERTTLSTFRSLGAALGAVPAMLLIVFCYTGSGSDKVMSHDKVLIGVIIIAVIEAAACILSQHLVTERIQNPPKTGYGFRVIMRKVKQILSTRAFLSLSVAAMLYLAASVFSQSYYTYLADKYFNMNSLSILAMVAQYIPVVLALPFTGRLTARCGRKKLCSLGMLLSAAIYIILYIIQTDNPWIFLGFCFLAGLGNAFMFLQVWALATEVVDYNREVLGITDDAVGYSLFSFIRKLGHAVSAVFVNVSLMEIGYSTANLSSETLKGMYDSSVLIPALLYLSVFFILAFIYPINKTALRRKKGGR